MSSPLAWVESPLQLLGAAEWAHAHTARVDVAGRLMAQVEQTSNEVAARGARFGEQVGFHGIPWRMLATHEHWLVGDGFSGQFRLAAAVLRPKRITFLDDGLNAVAFADSLTGTRPYARPRATREGGLARRVTPLALDVVQLRAARGSVDLFTAFPLGDEREARVRGLGATVSRHGFDWVRSTKGSMPLGDGRVILGTARVADGLIDRSAYVAWVRRQAQGGPAVYLPHRRECEDALAEVARIGGVTVVHTGLPVELVLAAQDHPREIVTLPSSAVVTLRRVLAGSESVVREYDLADRPELAL